MDPLKAQQLAAELEVEMMADMYNRMTGACHKKCVPPHYKEAELSKGESVCLDRCVSKYLDIHERMGKKLTELSLQDEELMRKMQQGVVSQILSTLYLNFILQSKCQEHRAHTATLWCS
uniref:Mitochondrial import inner membrane translocase subunit n=1 Tax=Xenopus tropicalis TaxID=8364 RepID=A0A6I8R4Q6_XENTR